MNNIRVLIIEESAVLRQALGDVLDAAPGIKVISTTSDPLFAIEKIKIQWPDVIVLDIEISRMDGIIFLKMIMQERPTPIIIFSTVTPKGLQSSIEALAAGAVAIVTKPRIGLKQLLYKISDELISAVRSAVRTNQKAFTPVTSTTSVTLRTDSIPDVTVKHSADVILSAVDTCVMVKPTEKIVAIGTSTGGTQALEEVLTALPCVTPGILIVQHMPEKFTAAFAARLDGLCRIAVREASNNDRLIQGLALIAPGGKHMMLRRNGSEYFVEIVDGPLVNRHRPSVDVLFRSVAKCAGANALGVIMTGMGDDGAVGLLEMHNAGARTLAQDEESCVVYGMPKEAVRLGGVDKTVSLHVIHKEILQQLF